MAYGVSITGANDSFVFDTTIAGATAMPVVQGDTGVTSGNAYSGYTAGDLIFAKPANSNVYIIGADWSSTTPVAFGSQTFILLRPADTGGLAVNQNGTNYGLQIFDSDGTTVMYDSRHTNAGLDIKAGLGAGLPGGGSMPSGINGDFQVDESSSNLIYTAYNSNTYVLISSSYSRQMGFITVRYHHYRFKPGTTNIYYVGYYHWSGFGNNGFGGIPSSSQIIVGDLV